MISPRLIVYLFIYKGIKQEKGKDQSGSRTNKHEKVERRGSVCMNSLDPWDKKQ